MPTRADVIRRACAAQHFGAWDVEQGWFRDAVQIFNGGSWPMRLAAVKDKEDDTQPAMPLVEQTADGKVVWELDAYDEQVTLYTVDDSGLATIRVDGHIVKGDSSLGGTSSLRTQRALQMAADDEEVDAIIMIVDSPGGTVAGSRELADKIDQVDALKPVFGHSDDLSASAGYNVLSRTRRITANESSLIGSIGTVAKLVDSSKRAEEQGYKVHVLSTGKHKGTGIAGAPIDDEQLAAEQKLINDLGGQFVASVNRARGLNLKLGEGAADGRVFIAKEAKELGLIDDVASLEQAQNHIRETIIMEPKDFEQKHPDAVKAWKDEAAEQASKDATDAAMTAERKRIAELRDAFKDRPAFALDQIAKGHSLSEAKLELNDVLVEELADANKRADEATAAAKEATGAQADGNDALELAKGGGGDATDQFIDLEIEERIDAEWEADHEGCQKKFHNLSAYRGYRKHVLDRSADDAA